MARPTQDKIETFMRITGASESQAARRLEEYGGNLDEAINAHFSEVERDLTNSVSRTSPQYYFSGTTNQTQDSRGILPLLSAARSFRPSLLLDPSYRRNLINQIGSSVFTSRRDPRTGEFNNGYEQQPYHSGPTHAFERADGTSLSHHDHQFHGNVSRDLQGSDIEEQMIQFAIEASKQEDLSVRPQRHPHLEDDELAHALSLSLKTAEQEKAIRELTFENHNQLVVHNSTEGAEKTNDSRWQAGSSSFHGGAENFQEQSLWGGISSKELDEAILLEAAIFGEAPEGSSNQHAPQPPSTPDKNKGHDAQQGLSRPSPSLMERQLLREQQDDEYLASLLADREKEMNTFKKSGTSNVKEGESPNKILDEEGEFERLLAAKGASLPQEPAVNDENAVTLLVRMPDGSRCSRRFLKSHKLQFLFDFIDVGRTVKPGTYRVVRPFPRRSFSNGDISSSLKEVGLTNKQEALFLELI